MVTKKTKPAKASSDLPAAAATLAEYTKLKTQQQVQCLQIGRLKDAVARAVAEVDSTKSLLAVAEGEIASLEKANEAVVDYAAGLKASLARRDSHIDELSGVISKTLETQAATAERLTTYTLRDFDSVDSVLADLTRLIDEELDGVMLSGSMPSRPETVLADPHFGPRLARLASLNARIREAREELPAMPDQSVETTTAFTAGKQRSDIDITTSPELAARLSQREALQPFVNTNLGRAWTEA